ncbi:wHTH domain-containing protein [Streptomyces bicolor]|uniref:wHTH domain-containing protein n=1 Tax=Streptomyces bicolor TaxID=66874 RepID=UPI00068A3419|nr:hypothetical protein [Streptomyces bicolor]
MAEPLKYWTALNALLERAGYPEAAAVRAEMRRDLARDQEPPADSTVAGWLAQDRIPRRNKELDTFLSALYGIAQARSAQPVRRIPNRLWQEMASQAREARRNGDTGPDARPAAVSPTPTAHPRPDWRKEVAKSLVWQCLKSGDEDQTSALRQQAEDIADRLSELYDEVRHSLADDPWHDVHLARRTSHRANRLIDLLRKDREGFLTPAEAALIALLPFLYQVHRSRTAAELSHVEPTDLGQRTAPDEDRRMYEVLVRGHERLVRRAELGGLKDRRDGRPEIGWWLFHQWADQQPGRLANLLSAVVTPSAGLGELDVVLDPELLSRLLACAQAGPGELFDPARAEHLREEAFPLDFHGRDFQDVRERLVGSLFAIAHGMAIEVTSLPSVVVRHVGIPEALVPATLLTTVDKASWRFGRGSIGLKAGCDHPAVVAALTEHSRRVESLLQAVRQVDAPELDALPLYTRADDVREVDDKGSPVPIGGVIRFRLDEERVQELLMGENLYRDRSLAIRELYQNALDACRYRRARSQAADSFSSYQGRIEFTQGFDEAEGRHYLECRDNGVGMDELTLSEVFSQAGVRFTDLPRYQEERQEWQGRGVTMHPNSRFGIGVLSYFMLADEVRVTTCHMDPVEGRLREITVLITGPGHYFRVRPTCRAGTIGTTVRLYLREGDKAPSCVRELRRFLGIAEFGTTAEHGAHSAEWEAGVLRPRESLGLHANGFEAHGRLVSWSADPAGRDGQVVWCRHGGGLLVDGIHAEPRVRHGILSGPGDLARPRGVVVNLSGTTRPRRLSVDRTEILDDDVCADVERLVRDALPTLLSADPPLLDYEWLSQVAEESPRLADIVTEAAGAAEYELELYGCSSSMAVTGFFPRDVDVVRGEDLIDTFQVLDMYNSPDHSTRLWRLLAHGPNAMLTALAEIVPELNRVERVLPALPSDALIRITRDRHRPGFRPTRPRRQPTLPGRALLVAGVCGLPYREVASRMAELCVGHPDLSDVDPVVDEINFALMSNDLRGVRLEEPNSIRPCDRTVPPGHLLKAHFEFGISVGEAARRMEAFGFALPELTPAADEADELALRLLSRQLDGKQPWCDVSSPVHPGHLLRAHFRLGVDIGTAVQWMKAFGFTVVGEQRLVNGTEETLRLVSVDDTRWLSLEEPVSTSHVLGVAAELGRSVSEVARELRELGFHVDTGSVHERLTEDALAESAGWGWSHDDWGMLRDGEAIPPGLLVRAASRLGVSLHEMSERIRALALTPPSTLPKEAEDADTVILRTFPAYSSISLLEVAGASLESGLPPNVVASRLRAYGLVPPATALPSVAEPDDVILLDWTRLGRSPLSPDLPVPVGHVLELAVHLGDSPRAVLDRLAQYGLTTRPEVPSEELDAFDLRLLVEGHLELADESPVPLHRLVSASWELDMDLGELVRRLVALGFEVRGDRVSHLDEIDHFLCTWRSSTPSGLRKPLSLADPIPDFLRIVLSEAPADGLPQRLERLGVDLDRVREAVRTALPNVPGLVMKPEPESAASRPEATSPTAAPTAPRSPAP